METPRD